MSKAGKRLIEAAKEALEIASKRRPNQVVGSFQDLTPEEIEAFAAALDAELKRIPPTAS